MPELRIPMDPLNPGQFFACCGLIELFDLGGAEVLSRFEVAERRPRRAEFVLESAQALDPDALVRELREARCQAIEHAPDAGTVAPVRLGLARGVIEMDWWLDEFRADKTRFKCWAGQQTSLSIALELLRLLPQTVGRDVLNIEAMTTSRYGVDPRSSWKALDFGFSPNEQKKESATFAGTEVLAAIGLQGFRPGEGRIRRQFRYTLWRHPLPRAVVRLGCAEPWDGFGVATYECRIAERGSYKFFEFSERSGGR